MFAWSTGYVHATLIFLDVGATLWTRFAIGLNPCKIFRIRLFFYIPFLNLFAMSWLMLFFHAFETKAIVTFALNNIFLSKVILFNNVITILGWAPLDLPVVISELFTMPEQVLLFEIEFGDITFLICDIFYSFWEMLEEERVWNNDITLCLDTFGKDACCS